MSPREQLLALEHFGIKLGLGNITALLDALRRPERAFRAVLIAGTNGKGSVSAMVERGLRAAGHRTGRYTSPHLVHLEERIAIDGAPVATAAFDATTRTVLDITDELRHRGGLTVSPTFFEVTTAIAFELFRRAEIEVGVIEVGLGGRFDATNTVSPVVSVITSIALDHERHLGQTVAEIAFEKAGIIKPDTPVVMGELPPAAAEVVLRRAAELRAPVVRASRADVAVTRWDRGRATIRTGRSGGSSPDIRLGLNGAHQVDNAVVAIRTLETCAAQGIAVAAADIRTGLSDVAWPARLEWLRLPTGHVVLVDAAHNPAGAAALAAYLDAAGVGPVTLVTAIMRDKDVRGILSPMAGRAAAIVATSPGGSRALPPDELARLATEHVPDSTVTAVSDPCAAMDVALKSSRPVCVAGSIFLAGPLRELLRRRGAVTVDAPS